MGWFLSCFFPSFIIKPRQNWANGIDVFQFTQSAFWFDKCPVIGDMPDTPQILIKQNTLAETEHNGHLVWHTVWTQCQNTMSTEASDTDEKNKEKSVDKWQMERTRKKCSTSRKSVSSMWHVLANNRGCMYLESDHIAPWTTQASSIGGGGGVRIQADRERMASRKSFTPCVLPSRGVAPEGISSGHTESHRMP